MVESTPVCLPVHTQKIQNGLPVNSGRDCLIPTLTSVKRLSKLSLVTPRACRGNEGHKNEGWGAKKFLSLPSMYQPHACCLGPRGGAGRGFGLASCTEPLVLHTVLLCALSLQPSAGTLVSLPASLPPAIP